MLTSLPLVHPAAPWTSLSQLLPSLFGSDALALRAACWQIYQELPEWLAAEPVQNVVGGLSAGLKDQSAGVRLAALGAAVALIQISEVAQLESYAVLAMPILEVCPLAVTIATH